MGRYWSGSSARQLLWARDSARAQGSNPSGVIGRIFSIACMLRVSNGHAVYNGLRMEGNFPSEVALLQSVVNS